MSTITRRSVRRVGPTGHNARDHFAMVGVDRSSCTGASLGKRVIQGKFQTKLGLGAFIFSHPTKKRTKGRMCWAIVGAAA